MPPDRPGGRGERLASIRSRAPRFPARHRPEGRVVRVQCGATRCEAPSLRPLRSAFASRHSRGNLFGPAVAVKNRSRRFCHVALAALALSRAERLLLAGRAFPAGFPASFPGRAPGGDGSAGRTLTARALTARALTARALATRAIAGRTFAGRKGGLAA